MTPIVKLHFDAISAYYGETTAKRSGVLYIEHISKGLVILDAIGALEHSKCAFVFTLYFNPIKLCRVILIAGLNMK